MLLAIDVGNSQTHAGLYEGDELLSTWRMTTIADRTADELRFVLWGLLDMDDKDHDDLTGVAVSSVVPAVTEMFRRVAGRLTDGPVVVVEPGVRTGMPIAIDNPREVGADRVVNSVGARERYGSPIVVVDFGTSTNFDVVGAGGEYLGGAIAPGLVVSTNALVEGAAALRNVELVPPRSPVGKGTIEAIQSGAIYGHAGLVDGIMSRLVDELDGDVQTVATGGLASTIVPHCATVSTIDEYLTLDGLRLIYDMNADE